MEIASTALGFLTLTLLSLACGVGDVPIISVSPHLADRPGGSAGDLETF